MSMMRRILRHVSGGVVASVVISYILDNYCFIAIEKSSARGARTHYLPIRIRTR